MSNTSFKDPEIVICAAVMTKNGMIFRGHRHNHCINVAHDYYVWNKGINPGEHNWKPTFISEQGFVTSRNRFVSREEGYRLQVAAGIESVAVGGYRGKILFSEDLY